ncbi:MAG: bifunctional diguanylate cyclase/phosphodiesterase [Neomegalonema sp.]|nr:bifunctional diguanylate cyclase/phosphodiesterase [Neomegalonema sp.]
MLATDAKAPNDDAWAEALAAAAGAAFRATAAMFFDADDVIMGCCGAARDDAAMRAALQAAAARARASALGAAIFDAPQGRVMAVAADGDALAVLRVHSAFTRSETTAAAAMLAAFARVERKISRIDEALNASRREFALSAHLAQFGIWSYDIASEQLTWSEELFGLFDIDQMEQICWERTQNCIHPTMRQKLVDAVERLSTKGEPFDLELLVNSGAANEKWIRMFGDTEWRDAQVFRTFGFAQDITDEKMLRDDFALLASRDYLTEIANRAAFTNRFQDIINQTNFEKFGVALFIIDVDNFKTINDSFGHDIGDRILREVSEVLLSAVGAHDVVGRLGGDEFGVVTLFPSDGSAAPTAERIRTLARRAPTLRTVNGGVTLSIGYTEISDVGSSFKHALKEADLALYEAKRGGRDQACKYNEAFGAAYSEREETLQAVDKALRAEQFEPFYQAKICLKTGKIAGFEALARWRCPDRGVLTPGAFWHAICDPRRSTRISETIIEQVIEDVARIKDLGLDPGAVALNLTEKQLVANHFVEDFVACLQHAGLEPSNFEVEVTEAVLLAQNVEAIKSNLEGLAKSGVAISFDDFGTGFASLTHLRTFPIDIIKIDKSFVTDIETNREGLAICNALIQMAHDLNMRVVAEGVETARGVAVLKECKCDYAQGYYFARPCPIDEAIEALRADAATLSATDAENVA